MWNGTKRFGPWALGPCDVSFRLFFLKKDNVCLLKIFYKKMYNLNIVYLNVWLMFSAANKPVDGVFFLRYLNVDAAHSI